MRAGVRTSRNTWVSFGPVGCLVVIFAPIVALVAFLGTTPGRIIALVVVAVALSPLLLVIAAMLVLAAKPILMRIDAHRSGVSHGQS